MSTLLLDVGNSRLKWCFEIDGELSGYGAAGHLGVVPKEASEAWLSNPPPSRVMVSNVAGASAETSLSDWCQQHWELAPEFIVTPADQLQIHIAYENPQSFGVDRWLALVAAHELVEGAVCVIDCGTAVTIDALNGDGRHLGGVIVPGIATMQQSLLRNTDGIARAIEPQDQAGHEVLANNTRTGLDKGALYAVCGAIEHTVTKIKRSTQMPIVCIVTGGDANSILAELEGDYHCHPHLVLQGLQALIAD